MSAWLFDNMVPGRTINFRGVDGNFTLRRIPTAIPPAGLLLIAGGIGITPMRVMFHDCIKKGIPVTLLHSIRDPREALFHEEFQKVCSLPKQGRGPACGYQQGVQADFMPRG